MELMSIILEKIQEMTLTNTQIQKMPSTNTSYMKYYRTSDFVPETPSPLGLVSNLPLNSIGCMNGVFNGCPRNAIAIRVTLATFR